MIGDVGLDERLTRTLAATGAADRLDEQLVGPFRGTFVGEVERHVGRNDADQVTAGTSMPFATSAVPTRTSSLPAAKSSMTLHRSALALDDVTIQPADAQTSGNGA